MAYVDDAMERTLEIGIPESSKLDWVRARDQATRSEMAQMINEGWPGGEAIEQALKNQAHYWKMEDKVAAAPREHESSPASLPKRQRLDDGRPQKKANILAGVSVCQTDRRKRKICGKWNGPNGCSSHEKDCPSRGRHVCNVKLPSGMPCERTDHNAVNHR